LAFINTARLHTSNWTGNNLSHCFQNWQRVSTNQIEASDPSLLACLEAQECGLFEDKIPSSHRVASAIFAEMAVSRKLTPAKNLADPFSTFH
jgi:hypothetical protein